MRSLVICTPYPKLFGVIGGECSSSGERRCVCRIFVGTLSERDSCVDGRILRWAFRKWDGGHGLD